MKGVTVANFPHDIRINLGAHRNLKGLVVASAPVTNARVKDYEIYVSANGEDWGQPVARGTLENKTEPQNVLFFAPGYAHYIRFVALSSHTGDDFAAISNIDIIPAN